MRVTTVLGLAGLAAGCATHSVATRNSNESTIGAAPSSVLTAKELARTVRQGSLMDALEQLRPSMLFSRGTTPVVSVDGGPPAELSILRMIPVSIVREVRLQRASSSVGGSLIQANGDLKVGAVIVVATWQGGRVGQ